MIKPRPQIQVGKCKMARRRRRHNRNTRYKHVRNTQGAPNTAKIEDLQREWAMDLEVANREIVKNIDPAVKHFGYELPGITRDKGRTDYASAP
jgi:hypothetical protein